MLRKCLTPLWPYLLLVSLLLPALGATAHAEAPTSGFWLAHAGPPDGVAPSRPLSGPLSEHDAALYHRIFALQEVGDWEAADALIAQLRDDLLLGHVLFQRYMHPTAYRSRYDELQSWLERYADHPNADQVYALARKRRPSGAAAPRRPLRGYLGGGGQELQEMIRVNYRSSRRRSRAEDAAVRAWRRNLEHLAVRGRADQALAQFRRQDIRPLIDHVEADIARWRVAQAYATAGKNEQAFSHAAAAARRSGDAVPEIHWTAGFSAWRLGKLGAAVSHFAALGEAENAHPAERSRAAFWAARAFVALRRPQYVTPFLEIAAKEDNFYGFLARAALGHELGYAWNEGGLKYSALRLLTQYPGARRAMALGQVGRLDLAEQEIRKLAARATPELMTGLIALAQSLHLPAAQMRLAQSLGSLGGGDHLGALYPVPLWEPDAGFTLDRALIFAIIRAESAFDPKVKSHVGALGLMQVMPSTARHLARLASLEPPRRGALSEPETSLSFGQAYLEHLLKGDAVGDNLIYLAAGYNAGPGRVVQWRRSLAADSDPLLFLESIPFKETRVYVKKVLANLWVYRARLGQPQPSLEAMVRAGWPTYRALDPKPVLHAQN